MTGRLAISGVTTFLGIGFANGQATAHLHLVHEFAIRAIGFSPFDRLVKRLDSWASLQSFCPRAFSVLPEKGAPQCLHATDRELFDVPHFGQSISIPAQLLELA